MKFALVGPCHPLRGGIAHYNARLFRALEDAGHQVRLYGMIRQYPGVFFPGTTQDDHSASAIRAPADQVLDSINPLSWRRTAGRISAFKPDAVVFQWWHPFFGLAYGAIAWMVRAMGDARILYLCHNVRPHEATVIDDLLLRVAYSPVQGFLVHAAEEQRRLEALMGRPPLALEVAPHPVYDVFERDPGLDRAGARARLGLTRPRQLLFFGYVRAYKGLDVLIEAMPAILARVDCELTIAGECYEDPAIYTDRIEALGIGDRVRFLNRYIANEEVPVFFEAADLCVLPYKQATQSGIVQVAYGLETPVVVTRVGGIPEVVDEGRTGLLVEPDSPEAVAEAVARYFEAGLEEALIAGIREKRLEMSWSRVVEALERMARAPQP